MSARRRKPKAQEPEEAPCDLTPMIDVTFLLLIFFVLNINFVVEEGELQSYLPKTQGQGTSPAQADLTELRVRLRRDLDGLRLQLGRRVYASAGELDGADADWLAHPAWAQLQQDLTAAGVKGAKGRPVIIDAGPEVAHSRVVRVVDAAISAEAETITFAAPEQPY